MIKWKFPMPLFLLQSHSSSFFFFMASLTTLQDCFVQRTRDEEEEIAKCYERYTNMISLLPKGKGWKSEFLVQYGGFWFQPNYGFEGLMWTREHFKAKSTDVFLTSTPKSGTTWLKALVFSIINRTKFDFSSHPLLTNDPHQLVPFFELQFFMTPPIADPEILPNPRIFASHISYNLLPQTIIDSHCKIIHICRDPKDVFVSLWHFMNSIKVGDYTPPSFEEAFDLFCKGISPSGPYWDLTLGYWKASLEFPNKVLFLKYEDLKENSSLYLNNLADFLGQPFTKEEEENEVVKKIVKLCSFESMSNMEVNKNGFFRKDVKNNVFFRKGTIGDWKNYLTPEMSVYLDLITEEKFIGSGLSF